MDHVFLFDTCLVSNLWHCEGRIYLWDIPSTLRRLGWNWVGSVDIKLNTSIGRRFFWLAFAFLHLLIGGGMSQWKQVFLGSKFTSVRWRTNWLQEMSKLFKSDPSGLAVSEPHGFLSLTTIWLCQMSPRGHAVRRGARSRLPVLTNRFDECDNLSINI